jgi:hypothetical protein
MKTREEIRLIRLRRLRRGLKSELKIADLRERNQEARNRLLARIRRQAAAKEGLEKAPRNQR